MVVLVFASFPHWTDFWIAVPLAILITIMRLYVMDPIATRLVVSRLALSPTSLRQRNAQEAPGKRIPKWVLNEIDGFAQDMLIVNYTETRKHARVGCGKRQPEDKGVSRCALLCDDVFLCPFPSFLLCVCS